MSQNLPNLRYGKAGNKKSATCFATLLHSELNSDVARFTTNIKPLLQQIRLLTGLNVGGKTRNVAIQLVLQQCCKTNCRFFNTPFPSSKKSHFQNEAKCETFVVKMSFICIIIKNHFHINGFALSLALKVRFFGTRKWPICCPFLRTFG